MLLAPLARLLFGKILNDDAIKKRLFLELRNAAAKSSTKLDDELVDGLEVVYDVALPILLGK